MIEELASAEQGRLDQEIVDAFYGKGSPAAETINALVSWETKNKGVLQARAARLKEVIAAQTQRKVQGYDGEMELNVAEKPLAPALTFLVDRVTEIVPEAEKIVGKTRTQSKVILFPDFDQAVEKIQPFLTNLREAGKYLPPKQ